MICVSLPEKNVTQSIRIIVTFILVKIPSPLNLLTPMKKLSVWALTLLLAATISLPLSATTNPSPAAAPATPTAEAQVLLNRLNEINAMDKAPLSGTEKRKLRKEVKTIKKELAQANGGVYLSVGAVIIIILLLILLL